MENLLGKLEDIADRLADSSRQEIKQAFDGITDLLEIRTEPFEISEAALLSGYSSLQTAAEYHSTLLYCEREEHRQANLDFFHITEFQASWYVLKRFLEDEKIKNLSDSKRTEAYLRYLYSFPQKFRFFKPRETALEKLSQAGFISLTQHKIETPLKLISYP